jgi:hypothetical protein
MGLQGEKRQEDGFKEIHRMPSSNAVSRPVDYFHE